MTFNVQNFGRVSSSANVVVKLLQDGTLMGAPGLYTYISNVDTIATISAADYFAAQAPTLNVGDSIYVVGSDTQIDLNVAAVTLGPPASVITVQSAAFGDVSGPALSTNNALARFSGATGRVLKNSSVSLNDAGDLSQVNSIANASGTTLIPSYTFTGEQNSGIWKKAAGILGFATLGLETFEMANTAASVQWIRVIAGAAGSGLVTSTCQFQAIPGVGGDANIDIGFKGLGTGGLSLLPTAAGTAGTLRFWNPAGTFWSAFKAGANTVNTTFSLPIDAPTVDGQVMSFTAAGVGSWVSIPDTAWINQAATPLTMAGNASYIANTGGLLTFNMPAVVGAGTEFEVAGLGAGGWLIQMNTGQTANLNSTATSVAGSLASTNRYNCIKLLCTVANTTFTVIQSSGTITCA